MEMNNCGGDLTDMPANLWSGVPKPFVTRKVLTIKIRYIECYLYTRTLVTIIVSSARVPLSTSISIIERDGENSGSVFSFCPKYRPSYPQQSFIFTILKKTIGSKYPRTYRRESVPGDHYMCKTIYFGFNNLPCPHQIEFDRHFCCSCLARDLALR